MQWFANTAATFYCTLGTDIEPLFFFLESLPDATHDVDQEAVLLLMGPLRQIPNVLNAALRTRVMGLISRSIGKLNKAMQRNKSSMTGLQAVVEELDRFLVEGPSEVEMESALAETERSWLSSLASQEERADLICHYTLLADDIHICVPAQSTARIQEVHLLTLHCLCDAVDLQLLGEQDST